MVKKQQMRWTREGAHLLLQVRTKTFDGDLRDAFCGWYPGRMPMERLVRVHFEQLVILEHLA